MIFLECIGSRASLSARKATREVAFFCGLERGMRKFRQRSLVVNIVGSVAWRLFGSEAIRGHLIL